MEQQPHRLVEDIQGMGFKIADQLAEELGIASDALSVSARVWSTAF